MVEDVDKIVSYYRSHNTFVRTDHLLVKLVSMFNIPLDYDLDRYYEIATARAMAVCNSLDITTTLNEGRWFDGVFYRGSREMIFGYAGTDSPFELAKDWRNLQAVKVLDCPVSNLNYMLPNGQMHNVESGLASIAIDVPKLMIQWRGFLLHERMRMMEDEGSHLGPRDFIGKYVIPNMLYSQSDIVIHNRLMNLQSGAPMGDSVRKHPFHITDYSDLLDIGLGVLLERFQRTQMRYEDLLENIPKVFSDAPLAMPDMLETRQCWWRLFLTRLKAIEFLTDVAGETGRHYNRNSLNELKIDLKRFKSDNIFTELKFKSSIANAEMSDDDLYIDIKYRLKQLLELT